MRRSLLPALALGGVLGVLAGCGSSDDSDEGAAATSSAATVATVSIPSPPPTASTPSTTGAGSEPPPFTATPLTPEPTTPPAGSTPPSAGPPTSVDAPAAQLPEVQAAVADLAERLAADPADVTVLEVREVTWRDGSLGCPEPGLAATQALVSGQLVVLERDSVRYEYHSGPGRPLFYCAKPNPPLEP